MTTTGTPKGTYERGKALSERVNPGMEDALAARYDALVPGMSRTIVDVAYGQFYAREGLDEKTRLLATVAALTALGAQTRPQLKVNIASARKVGASPERNRRSHLADGALRRASGNNQRDECGA